MMMNLMVIIGVLVIGYTWVTRGFLSAFLNLICVVIAGAIAFAVWEPASMALIKASPARGMLSFLQSVAWGLGLAGPFIVALAILRIAVDKAVGKNAQCDDAVEWVGGGICGLGAGIITTGILVLSIGLIRAKPDFMGYERIAYTTEANGRGSLVRSAKLWVPVDTMTAGLYTFLSENALRTGEPLAKWYPDFEDVGPTLRHTYDGKSRMTLKPEDFAISGRYQIGKPDGRLAGDIMADFIEDNPQKVLDPRGELLSDGRLEGFMVEFKPGAREKHGQVVIGPGQLRLLCENAQTGQTKVVHPAAVSTQAEAASKAYGRFQFNSNNFYVATAGAGLPVMGFEFPVPAGYDPIAIYVKNIRKEVPPSPGNTFATGKARDDAIRTGQLFNDPTGEDPDAPEAPRPIDRTAPEAGPDGRLVFKVRKQSNIQTWPKGFNQANVLGFTIQKGTEPSGVSVEKANKSNWITDGEGSLEKTRLARYIDRSLMIDRFAVSDGVVLVKVNVSYDEAKSWIGDLVNSADQTLVPVLVDANGLSYDPVGYIYQDSTKVSFRYTPGRPVAGLTELVKAGITLSKSRPEQDLELVFRVSFGVDLKELRMGEQVIAAFDPPLTVEARQK